MNDYSFLKDTEFSKDAGIYIHVPFCLRKCFYCDFYSVTNKELIEKYVTALVKNIELKGKITSERKVDTVYFGGGTPSLMSPFDFEKILDTVYNVFDVSDTAEITAEVNPATASEDKLIGMRSAGINRLSIGMQSANDDELECIGRLHRHKDTLNTFYEARECGFDNISLDLMYALPNQTEKKWEISYKEAAKLSPEHISMYALTLSEDCELIKKKYFYPEDEVQLKMYADAIAYFTDLEYNLYEISNLAKKNRFSCHNVKYWMLRDYIGFGPGAHSFENGRRYFTDENIYSFINGSYDEITEEVCTSDDMISEKIMLSLRMSRGLIFNELREICGDEERFLSLKKDLMRKIAPFADKGYATVTCDGIRLTKEGFFISNGIICNLIP